MTLLSIVPLINIIFLCVWSFGKAVNPNRKNYARALLILIVIFTAIGVAYWFTIGESWYNYYMQIINSLK